MRFKLGRVDDRQSIVLVDRLDDAVEQRLACRGSLDLQRLRPEIIDGDLHRAMGDPDPVIALAAPLHLGELRLQQMDQFFEARVLDEMGVDHGAGIVESGDAGRCGSYRVRVARGI